MTKISVIIPTYNEKNNMCPLIERIESSLKEEHEIIIVDDDSPDGTAQIVTELSKKYPDNLIKLIVRKNEKGLAKAVVEGFKHATGDIYAVMDADLQHPPESLGNLIWEANNGADIAVGSRYAKGGGFEKFRMHRKIMSQGANMIAKILFPKLANVNDLQSGFFALKKDVIKNVDLKPTGYKILLEILAIGNYKSVKEVPYQFSKREYGESKLGSMTILDYLHHVTSLMFRETKNK